MAVIIRKNAFMMHVLTNKIKQKCESICTHNEKFRAKVTSAEMLFILYKIPLSKNISGSPDCNVHNFYFYQKFVNTNVAPVSQN